MSGNQKNAMVRNAYEAILVNRAPERYGYAVEDPARTYGW